MVLKENNNSANVNKKNTLAQNVVARWVETYRGYKPLLGDPDGSDCPLDGEEHCHV
jgi:hypothetical protein